MPQIPRFHPSVRSQTRIIPQTFPPPLSLFFPRTTILQRLLNIKEPVLDIQSTRQPPIQYFGLTVSRRVDQDFFVVD